MEVVVRRATSYLAILPCTGRPACHSTAPRIYGPERRGDRHPEVARGGQVSCLIDRRRCGVRAVCGADAVDLIGNQRGAAVRHTEVPGASAVSVTMQSIVAVAGRAYAWTCVGTGDR